MVGDFMVCVDRIIASTGCIEASNGAEISTGECAGVSPLVAGVAAAGVEVSGGAVKKKIMKKLKGSEVIECRICQEEGDDSDMEAPCACNGTLKFAHRKCIQKWCNKKGNITCEICNEVFSPNYYAPPPRSSSDVFAIDIRQNWGARFDLHDSHFLAIAAAEQDLLNAEYEDYAPASTSGIACCRTVALILMLLLFIRHILIATREIGMVQDISALFNVCLEFFGIFLPCFVIIRSCYLIQSRRRRQI